MTEQIQNLAIKQSRYLAELCGVECSLFVVEQCDFAEDHCKIFCRSCNANCRYQATHTYGCLEAQRWDGKYIYYCPMGLIFVAGIIRDLSDALVGAIIAGPVIMGELLDTLSTVDKKLWNQLETLPHMTTTRVNCLSETLSAICLYISQDKGDQERVSAAHVNLLNIMYENAENTTNAENYHYLIGYEKQLQNLVISGNKSASQQLLNKMLGKIYFASRGNLDVMKARIVELVVLLSRSAIEGGADINQIFWLNTNYIKEIEQYEDLDELSSWLTRVIHRFINCVFDFNDIKHVDTMYKVIEYINFHYNERISLDDVAETVYLSRSYLSKIFKEEIGLTFTAYINKLRVEKCKIFLLDNTISLVDIANLVGFEDQSYFTKVFKKVTGISPGRFRELRGKIN